MVFAGTLGTGGGLRDIRSQERCGPSRDRVGPGTASATCPSGLDGPPGRSRVKAFVVTPEGSRGDLCFPEAGCAGMPAPRSGDAADAASAVCA